METSLKNVVNKQFGFNALNISSLENVFWYRQSKYYHHYGGYTNVGSKCKFDIDILLRDRYFNKK